MESVLAQVTYSYEVSTGFSAAYTIIILLFAIATYVFSAICLMKMGQKTGQEYPWFAWIPILNFYLMVQIAQKDVVWFILCLIPCVNFIVLILVWMSIAEVMGFENWWGILMIIPIFNFYVMYKLAFTEPY